MAGTAEHVSLSLREYDQELLTATLKHPEWRKGQRFFNVLYDLAPEVADEIRGTEIDPFYHDDVVPLVRYLYERFDH